MSPPPTLEYRSKGERPPNPDAGKEFAWGLCGGVALSSLVYFPGFRFFKDSGLNAAVFISLGKLFIGYWLATSRRFRALGLGILVSILVGAMIFFGNCAAHLK